MVGVQFTPRQRAFMVLRFAETHSAVQVQQEFRRRFGRAPPTPVAIMNNFKKYHDEGTSQNLCKKRSDRPRTCQLIMIVSLDIINNDQIHCHSLGFCNVTGTFIYFKTIKLAIATTLVVSVRVPFNFITWNKVVYTFGYVITYIIKTTEPNHLILILNLANKSYFIIKVNFCHLLAWF